jgi:spoIIIJ-associated protein
MEWVETTGRTIDEAKEAALDQLGVDAQDAEFEVMAEPKSGLFGRMRVEARVRARVRPMRPRPKDERGNRRRRDRDGDRRRSGSGNGNGGRQGGGGSSVTAVADAPARSSSTSAGRSAAPARTEPREVPEMTLSEQAEIGRTFLTGLVSQFEPAASVAVETVDDDTMRLAVSGGELGLLIGPKGQTLSAIQELVRTVVQRHTASREGWLVVDVNDYRQKRRAALERFARHVAEQVVQTGEATSLEAMSAADRKIVHDTINDIDGVATHSEGEDPRRWVVISPATAD